MEIMKKCLICPRMCGIDRTKYKGFCSVGEQVRVARAALHFYEEPCISGENGSGTVFFSGCSLKCVFCQNKDVSQNAYGKDISIERLGEIFLELQAKGAHNINLVTPTHYVPQIVEAFNLVKDKLNIPIVYNTGGYDRVETLKMLEGVVDIYLTDFKYMDSKLSKEISGAENYFTVVSAALKEMLRQTGKPQFDDDGMMKKGVIVRHMVVPGHTSDSIRIIKYLAKNYSGDDFLMSVMSQYTPDFYEGDLDFLKRRVTDSEYKKVCRAVEETEFEGFLQERSSAEEKYTPVFDCDGV